MNSDRDATDPAPIPRTGWSIRAHLLSLVIVTLLAVAAGSAYAYTWSWAQARADAVDRMGFQSGRAAASIADTVGATTRSVAALAAQPGLSAALARPSGCTLTFEGSGAFPEARLDVVGADGVVACSSGVFPSPRSRPVHAGSPWLTQAFGATGPTVIDDSVDPIGQRRSMVIAAPIPGAHKAAAAAGAVVVFLHLDPAAAALNRHFGGSSAVRFAYVDQRSGNVLASTDAPGAQRATDPFLKAGTAGSVIGTDGQRLIYNSAVVANSEKRVYAALPYNRVFSEARGSLVRQLSLGVLAVLILVVGVWLLNRRIAHPLRDVIDAADAASRDPDAAHVRASGTAETVALARAFNAMLDVRAGHEAQLAHLATHDSLTGLPNKALFVQRLERALSGGASAGVVSLGLDRFIKINDAIGHQAGDQLLRDVAARFGAVMRPEDTLARFGSDEFVMLCADVTTDQAIALAARLQAALSEPFRGPVGDVVLSATAGVAAGRHPATSGRRLLGDSDTALHEAKSAGEQLHIYDPALRSRATAHLILQRELAQALQADELVVHYQPLIDLPSGAVVGAEALVRWQHPQRGLVPPNDFIPVAEQTGQITALGELVLNEACEQAVRWAVAGHHLTVSVNVAASQLRDGTFPETVERALAATGLPADQLCLEITESSLMTASPQLTDDLRRLRTLGVHVALDDFGTGYSSLSYLQELPCDELKIDRSFVSRLQADSRELHLVIAIVGMARALGLTVVAEGVETEQQRKLLAGLGCHVAQGYLFSPPLPEDAFTSVLAPPSLRTQRLGRHVG